MNLQQQLSYTLFFMCDTKAEGLEYLDQLRNGYHGTAGWVYHGMRGHRHAFTATLCKPVCYVSGVVECAP